MRQIPFRSGLHIMFDKQIGKNNYKFVKIHLLERSKPASHTRLYGQPTEASTSKVRICEPPFSFLSFQDKQSKFCIRSLCPLPSNKKRKAHACFPFLCGLNPLIFLQFFYSASLLSSSISFCSSAACFARPSEASAVSATAAAVSPAIELISSKDWLISSDVADCSSAAVAML